MSVEDGQGPVANSLPVYPVTSIEDNLYNMDMLKFVFNNNDCNINVRSIRVHGKLTYALLE